MAMRRLRRDDQDVVERAPLFDVEDSRGQTELAELDEQIFEVPKRHLGPPLAEPRRHAFAESRQGAPQSSPCIDFAYYQSSARFQGRRGTFQGVLLGVEARVMQRIHQ